MARTQLAPVSIEFKPLRLRFVSFYCGKNYKSAGLSFEFPVSSFQFPVFSSQLSAPSSQLPAPSSQLPASSFSFQLPAPSSERPAPSFELVSSFQFAHPVDRVASVANGSANSAKCPNRGARLAPDHFRAANVGSREEKMGNPG